MAHDSSVAVYTFEDANGHEPGSYTTMNYDEACGYAERCGLRVIENVFEWADSEMVRDYTGS
jgi:hypothetical protein